MGAIRARAPRHLSGGLPLKPRVLFLHHNAVLGGAELHLIDVAHCFRESSRVVLFTEGPLRASLEAAGVNVEVAATAWALEGVRGGRPRLSARGVVTVLKLAMRIARLARQYDLIYANSPKALTVAAVAGRFSTRPVLWAFHDLLDPAHFSSAAMRQMAITANWGTRRIMACSEASAASLVRYGVRGEIGVVHHGIAMGPCSACFSLRPIAAVFGRLTAWKGQHVAIDLPGRIPDLQLLIVGEAEEADYTSRLRRRAEALGVSQRVSFLGHRDDVPQLLQQAGIVLHTSIAPEPFGRVIVEAMLAGRPVIAANAGGVPEIIEDGVSGLLVPPGDVDALAAAVSSLLRDPARAKAIAEAGGERARRNFTLEQMLSKITRHIEEAARR